MTDIDPMCPVLDHDDSGLDTCKDECNPQHLGDRSDCAKDHYCCRYNFLILGKYSVFCFQVFSTKDFSIKRTLHLFYFRALCGGYKCMKSTFKGNKPKKCKVADQFMQCVYQKIDTHLCSN